MKRLFVLIAAIGLCTLPAYAQSASATVDASGVVRFPFGYGTPTLQCSPVHACAVMLQQGESVIDVIAGDTVRWQIVRGASGRHADIPTFYFKPVDNGIPNTNLIVTTNRRTYNVNLQSVNYIQHELYGFFYSAGDSVNDLSSANPSSQAPPMIGNSAAVPPPSLSGAGGPTTLDFNYCGTDMTEHACAAQGDERARPQLACNDGDHTWLLMPENLRDAPSVYVVDPNGQQSLVTVYRNGRWYRLNGVPRKIVIITSAHEGGVQAIVEHVGG